MEKILRFNHSPKFAGVASDVVSVPIGDGRQLLFLSGVAPERPDGQWMNSDLVQVENVAQQVSFVWNRIAEILQLHGATLDDIVKVTLYTIDARYLMDPVGASIAEIFKARKLPAVTGVTVAGLAWPGMAIEIDVTAVAQQSQNILPNKR